MTLPLTRADSLREYLSGASSDGQRQDGCNLSYGNFRSSVEAYSYAIHIANYLKGVEIEVASGGNPAGVGKLSSADGLSLQWQPPLALIPGPKVPFILGQTTVQILEGPDPSQFLRVSGFPPFTVSTSLINLTILLQNVFGFNNVLDADATAGITQYRATIIRNESGAGVSDFYRWLDSTTIHMAIGFDPAGVQAFGSAIYNAPDDLTPPPGIVWNTGITKLTGLHLANLAVGKQIGFWLRRTSPVGALFAPNVYNTFHSDFKAY